MKRSPLKTKPNKIKSKRFAEQYHSAEFVCWIHGHPCSTRIPGILCDYWPIHESVASHVSKSKGAGGTWRDVAPQCEKCHRELHQKGPATFCQARGWPLERLSELAAGYAREWEAICQP